MIDGWVVLATVIDHKDLELFFYLWRVGLPFLYLPV
jgi:hypothetical protein